MYIAKVGSTQHRVHYSRVITEFLAFRAASLRVFPTPKLSPRLSPALCSTNTNRKVSTFACNPRTETYVRVSDLHLCDIPDMLITCAGIVALGYLNK